VFGNNRAGLYSYDENHHYFLLQSSVQDSDYFNFNILFKAFFMKTKNFESCSIYPGEFIPGTNEAFVVKQLKRMKYSANRLYTNERINRSI